MKRTGAAAAVATDELAVPDATSLGIVGAGVQSYTQLEAIAAVRDIDEVVISDPTRSASPTSSTPSRAASTSAPAPSRRPATATCSRR